MLSIHRLAMIDGRPKNYTLGNGEGVDYSEKR
jgi:hypothetical protein